MRILVIGGGGVTEELLRVINLKRNQVIVIEKSPERCSSLSSRYDVLVINKDATDVSVYTSDISMSEFDAVLALTDKDEVNIFALTVAKLYKIPFRLARVKNPKVAELITQLDLGVSITLPSVIADVVRSYLEALNEPKRLASFKDFHLFMLTLSETDKVVNKRIKDLDLPEDVDILLIFDGTGFKVPHKDDVLLNGYQLLVISRGSDVVKVFKG